MSEFDALIIMGGPMGVYDDHLYDWLPVEKKFIANAIAQEKKIIGVCLGAQLLAVVLGASVSINQHKEIGWFPVKIATTFIDWLGEDVPPLITVFHWHGDTFDIPQGGVNHAVSEACKHQLFSVGKNIIGLQFHLEATPQSVREMLLHGKNELIASRYVQLQEIIALPNQYFAESHLLMDKILKKMMNGST